jgi:hypothetical protein
VAGRVLAGCDIRWLTGEPGSKRKGTNMANETSDDRGESESSGEDVTKCYCGAVIKEPDLAKRCEDCGGVFCCRQCFEDHLCDEDVDAQD